jgi:DNA-binding NtrC family response regulator
LLPRAGRRALLTLEEARAMRGLADRISSLLTVTSALSRARERETLAQARLGTLEADRERLERALESREGRHRAAAERLAQRARGAAYAAASRTVLDALERAGRSASGIGLVTPPGVDPTGWAAHAHLASDRAGGPFVTSDAALPAEQAVERWNDPEKSPLRLADGGTLLLLDVDALPLDVQEHVASTLAARRSAPSTLPAPGLVVSSHASIETLSDLGKIAPALRRAITTEISLPALVDRAEDLRALVLSALARESARVGREPLGVDSGALRLLVEHTWPGNEIELEAVLLRAVRVAGEKTVTAEDLSKVGFEVKGLTHRSEAFTPGPPPPSRRRAPRRWGRSR